MTKLELPKEARQSQSRIKVDLERLNQPLKLPGRVLLSPIASDLATKNGLLIYSGFTGDFQDY